MAFYKTLVHDDSVKQYLKAWLLEQGFARIKYGTYTGDGAVSQAITGVGFAPEIVIITLDGAGADSGVWLCTKQMAADECQEMISAGAATACMHAPLTMEEQTTILTRIRRCMTTLR